MTLVFCMKNAIDAKQDAHLKMIIDFLNHRGEGTLYDILKSLNYLQEMDVDPSTCLRTAMRFMTVELVLTQTGLQNYEKVLAITFEYLRKVREEWLPEGEEILFFKEQQKVGNFSWNVYQEQDTEELLDKLSQTMIHSKDPSRILKDTYKHSIIDKYEPERIKTVMSFLTYENCKIVLQAPDIVTKSPCVIKQSSLSEVLKEKWFGTKYKRFSRPDNPEAIFENQREWSSLKDRMKQPRKNPYIPEKLECLTPASKQKTRNDYPKLVKLDQNPAYAMYHLVDAVYLKPKTAFNLLMRIRQPKEQPHGKPVTFLQTPKDFAAFEIMKGCLHATATKTIGYEAKLAQIHHEMFLVDEMAVRILIHGYSETVLKFVEEYLNLMRDCAQQGGFEKEVVDNIMEEKLQEFEDANSDIADHATNNRICYLHATTFHPSLIAKAIQDYIDDSGNTDSFCPGKFLKERILDEITATQIICVGNTSQQEAENFCKAQIVDKFKLQPSNFDQNLAPVYMGSLFKEDNSIVGQVIFDCLVHEESASTQDGAEGNATANEEREATGNHE